MPRQTQKPSKQFIYKYLTETTRAGVDECIRSKRSMNVAVYTLDEAPAGDLNVVACARGKGRNPDCERLHANDGSAAWTKSAVTAQCHSPSTADARVLLSVYVDCV